MNGAKARTRSVRRKSTTKKSHEEEEVDSDSDFEFDLVRRTCQMLGTVFIACEWLEYVRPMKIAQTVLAD